MSEYGLEYRLSVGSTGDMCLSMIKGLIFGSRLGVLSLRGSGFWVYVCNWRWCGCKDLWTKLAGNVPG